MMEHGLRYANKYVNNATSLQMRDLHIDIR